MRRLIPALLGLALPSFVAAQSVTINLVSYGLYADDGLTLLPMANLLQLVNLGTNGAFDPIVEGAWVRGDGRLVNLAYGVNAPVDEPPDFPSAAAFDSWGAFSAGDGDGTSQMVLRFSDLPDGFYGLRWWASYTPQDYYGGAAPATGDRYGQFTRLDAVLHGNVPWIIVGDDLYNFDSLATQSFGGLDAESAGFAAYAVLADGVVIPEPATTAALIAVAALGLAGVVRRRRR